MSIDGSVFINPLTMCEVEVQITTPAHEVVKQTVKLGYARTKLNKALLASVEQLLSMPDDADVEEVKPILYPAFLQLVRWWSVKRGDEMWPLTATDIEPMDPYIIGVLLFGVIGHARRGGQGEAPRGPSAPKPSPASSEPTGAKTASPSPTISKKPTTSRSLKTSPASSPGNGSMRHLTTMSSHGSGTQRKSS